MITGSQNSSICNSSDMSNSFHDKSSRNSEVILGSTEPETNTVYLSDRTPSLLVSSSFRDWFITFFKLSNPDGSVTDSKLQLLRLAGYFLSNPGRWSPDSDESVIPVGQRVLREMMKPGSHDNNFNAARALQDFSKQMWKLTVAEYDYLSGETRSISSQKLPLELRTRLKEELKLVVNETFVDLVTGLRSATYQPGTNPSQVPEVEGLRLSLNRSPSSLFLDLESRIPEAKDFVLRQEWKEDRIRRQLLILRQVEESPKPNYKAVSGTSRLYSVGASWLHLMRPVREVLTSDYSKLDLRAAQLNISSALWGWDIKPFQASDGSVWTYLLQNHGFNKNNQSMKDQLKTFIYAALFGAETKSLSQKALAMGISDLLKDPMVQEMLKARKAFQKRLEDGEAVSDAWGQEHSVTETGSQKRRKQIRSIMAAICQSYELRMLIPLINHAKEKGYETVAILHDCIYGQGDWSPISSQLESLLANVSLETLGQDVTLEAKFPATQLAMPRAA